MQPRTPKSHLLSDHSRLDFDPLVLTLMATRIAIFSFLLSSLAILLAPDQTRAIFNLVMRPEFTQINRTLDWGTYLLGLLPFFLAVGTISALTALIYRHVRKDQNLNR